MVGPGLSLHLILQGQEMEDALGSLFLLMKLYLPPVQGSTRDCTGHSSSPSPLTAGLMLLLQRVFQLWDPTELLWPGQGPRVLELELGVRELLMLPWHLQPLTGSCGSLEQSPRAPP